MMMWHGRLDGGQGNLRAWAMRAQWVASQPSWAVKLAVATGVLVLLPLVLFALLAVLLAGVVLVTLAVAVSAVRGVGRWWRWWWGR